MSVSVRIDGLREALAMLGPDRAERALGILVKRVHHEAHIRMAVYPPETEANKPGGYPTRWYQRHFGPRWALKKGGIGGRNTSEQLQKSWREVVVGPIERRVETEVSYAEYVLSAEKQTAAMQRIGWQTDEEVAQEVGNDPRLMDWAAEAIEEAYR